MQHIQSGKLKALAVSSPNRLEVLPQVPTMAEAGVAGFDASPWFGIVAPAGTPADIVAKLNADIVKVMSSQAARRALAAEGALITTNTPEQFTSLIKADLARWGGVVKASNMKVE